MSDHLILELVDILEEQDGRILWLEMERYLEKHTKAPEELPDWEGFREVLLSVPWFLQEQGPKVSAMFADILGTRVHIMWDRNKEYPVWSFRCLTGVCRGQTPPWIPLPRWALLKVSASEAYEKVVERRARDKFGSIRESIYAARRAYDEGLRENALSYLRWLEDSIHARKTSTPPPINGPYRYCGWIGAHPHLMKEIAQGLRDTFHFGTQPVGYYATDTKMAHW
jgi:hypothetical protein